MDYLAELSNDKIKINRNKNPIKMQQFLSFLKVDTARSTDHLGACNGWTLLRGADGLKISGGVVNGVEYLDSIEYKQKLHNKYNNFVNPFYLTEILTDEGIEFFVKYYADEIEAILTKNKNAVENAKLALAKAKENNKNAIAFFKDL